MDKTDILKLENGTLYLRLQENFNHVTLEASSVVAKITKDDATIANPDETNRLTLNHHAIELLNEGTNIIEIYWSIDTLPKRHVLFSCGCSIDWNDYCSEDPAGPYEPPEEGEWAYCKHHEETLMIRFNKIDFQ